jgi:hypothetical protein
LLLSSTSESSSDEDPSAAADIRDAYPVMRSVRVTVQRLDFANFLREEIARAEKEMQNGEKNGVKALKVRCLNL